jgi:hypothetical protein
MAGFREKKTHIRRVRPLKAQQSRPEAPRSNHNPLQPANFFLCKGVDKTRTAGFWAPADLGNLVEACLIQRAFEKHRVNLVEKLA